MTHDRRDVTDPLPTKARVGPQEPLGGEERHLRVVRDRARATVRGSELSDRVRAELPPDLVEALELDRRAKRVAERTAKKAATPALSTPRQVRLDASLSASRSAPGPV